ncbi:MAG: DUF2948 family protein [Alphaproteobacteria bacterium]|nr:DUF2948 family protein [Alphaproteobacteria bacterium]
MSDRLRLRATHLEDMSVISSMTQDALVSVADLSYDPSENSFTLVLNRFCWDKLQEKQQSGFSRSHSGLRFSDVEHVAYKGFNPKDTDTILSLMAVAYSAFDDTKLQDAGYVVLQFAKDKAIRLKVKKLNALLEDLGEAWFTDWMPGHEPD